MTEEVRLIEKIFWLGKMICAQRHGFGDKRTIALFIGSLCTFDITAPKLEKARLTLNGACATRLKAYKKI
jgi:hypothetical protein